MRKFIKGLFIGFCCMFMNMQAQGQGICGGGAFWEISDDRQTLTISGEGAVYAMGQDGVSQPWTADRNTIKTVIVEEGITALQWYSIGNLPNVDSISLPGSLYHVMNHALAKNTKLKKLILPGGIGFFGDNAFGFCDNLEEIVNLSTNPQSMEGTDVNFDKITLSVPPESKEKYKHDVWWGNFGKIKGIGEKDEDIEQEEKKNDEGQLGTEIYWKVQDSILRIWGTGVIPRIADVIIQPWHKLKAEIKYIVIGEGITEIGHFVFKSMLMEYIYLPETLVEIGDEIFKDCVNLKTITIPEKVMFMGWFTFDGCTGLRELIVMNKRPPYAYGDPFDDIYGSVTLYVPAESIESYKTDYDWKDFKNIKPIEEIERKEKSKNGNLERLKLNFEITPEFDPNTTDYYATVGWDVDRSNIIATPQDSFAKIKGTEQTLNTGDNLITIRVQPEDIYECPKEYNFHVYRKNGEARVKSLTINQGTLEPGFTRNTKEYIMRTTKENPFIIIEPTPVDEKAKVNVIKEIFSQDTTFVIRCTAEDEKFIEQYKIKLEVYNDNAYLKSLKVEGFTLEPEFQPPTRKYEVKVPHDTREVKIVAVPQDSNAIVSGQTDWRQLTGWGNLFTINVVAEDRVKTKTYLIDVIKEEEIITDIEKLRGFDEKVMIYTLDGKQLGSTERYGSYIVKPKWLKRGTFIAKGSKYVEKFTN